MGIASRDRHTWRVPLLRSKFGVHGSAAAAVIGAAVLLRLVLVDLGVPMTNSDEGTIGIMALHIAYRGQHPIFFYGQNYMGSWEAFLGAAIFHFTGPSLFALRLGLVGMFGLFLLSMYLLTRLLFSPAWALVTLILLGASSGFVMAQELRAIGGYSETLLFSALLFLCAAWLTLTYQQKSGRMVHTWRWPVYLVWGLVAGLGLWTDLLIAPAMAMSGLLLLTICWRELLRPLPLLCLLTGLLCGALPLISYNLHAAPRQDSLSILHQLDSRNMQLFTPNALRNELNNTFQASLPMMTGEPFCPVTELSFLGPNSPHSTVCTIAHSSWSLIYLLLLGTSGTLVLREIEHFSPKHVKTPDKPLQFRQQLVRLSLLFSSLLTLVLYTFSSAPQFWPGIYARYLICLLVATPVVFWPLWLGWQGLQTRKSLVVRVRRGLSITLLCYFCCLGLVGSILALGEVSAVRAMNQRDAALLQKLTSLSARHIYTDYWTCDKIAFESNEQVICAVLSAQLRPTSNRYGQYYAVVSADPLAAYVFSTDRGQFVIAPQYAALTRANAPLSTLPAPFARGYLRIAIDGYIIYQPMSHSAS